MYSPLQGLLEASDLEKLRGQAHQSGLINLGAALLAGSAPSTTPTSLGGIVGRAAPVYQQGYQSTMDTTLNDILKNMQIKDMIDKQNREKAFRENISKAYTMKPVGTGLTMSGKGSQAEMLSRPEFGGDFMPETVGALQSNVNLPQTKVLDQNKFMAALSEYSPLEYAKLAYKAEDKPEAIKTFEAFTKMNPQQQQQWLEFKRSGQPIQQVNLGEKGIDKITSKAVETYYDRADSARQMAVASNLVADLLEKQGGGKAVQIGTDLSRALGLGDKDTIASADAAAALVTQTAVKVRPAGSGSTSNIEFDAYRQSVPSLSNSPKGRRLMAAINTSFADRNEALADYAAQLYSQGKYSLKAMREYDQSLGSVLPKNFNEQFKEITGKELPKRRSY